MTTAAVDGVHAEPLLLAFLNAKGRNDPTRPDQTVRGILVTGNGTADSPAGRVQSWGGRIASGKARAFLSREVYAGPEIREKDKIRAINRRGQPWFEIQQIDDRDATRLVLHLSEA